MAETIIEYNFTDVTESSDAFDYYGPKGDGLKDDASGGYWCWDKDNTPSGNTGPSAGYNLGYIYTEASSPTAVGDVFSIISKDTFDLSKSTMYINFKYNPNCETAPPITISLWDGYRWNVEDTFTPNDSQLNDTWYDYQLLISNYYNTDVKIKVDVEIPGGGSTYRHDLGLDLFKITLVEESDDIMDYFSPYNIIKYIHFGTVFDGTTQTASDLETIINDFLAEIDQHSFVNYPDGVIITGPDNTTYLLRESVTSYVKIDTDLVTITNAESIVGWTGENVNLDKNVSINKRASVSSITTIANDRLYFELDTPIDITSKVLRLWALSSAFIYLDIKDAVSIYLYDGTNEAYWTLYNSLKEYSGGWINAILCGNVAPDEGTIDFTNISRIGIRFNYANVFDKHINTWIDFIRYGKTAYLTGQEISVSDYHSVDSAYGVGYGLITRNSLNNYNINSDIVIGGVNPTKYIEDNSVINFISGSVCEQMSTYTLSGSAGIVNEYSITNTVYNSDNSTFVLDMSNPDITSLLFRYNYVQNASMVKLMPNEKTTLITDNSFSDCGTFEINGAKFYNNVIINSGLNSNYIFHVTLNSDLDFTNNIRFVKNDVYCIYIEASVTEVTLDTYYFDNPDGQDNVYALFWAGSTGTLNLTLKNGTNLVEAGTLTAGGTINIVTDVDTTTDTLLATIDAMAADVRAIKVVQGENMAETETLIISSAGVKLVL